MLLTASIDCTNGREKWRRQGGGCVLGVVGGKGGGRVEETGWRVCVRGGGWERGA